MDIMDTGIYLSIPQADMGLFKDIATRMGWSFRTKEDMLLEYMESRPRAAEMSDNEITAEVHSVRYSL